MAVSDREIRVREPYAEGTAFGAAGVYEQLKGVVHIAVYLSRIHAAAEALIAQRLVRAEYLPLVLQLAAERYDAFMVDPAPTV